MTPWSERLLEMDLEELVGQVQPPDLRDRVRRAIATRARRAAWRRRALVALAVALLAAAALVLLRGRGDGPGPREADPFERLPAPEAQRLRGLLAALDVSASELEGERDPTLRMLRFKEAKEAEGELLSWLERSDPAARAAEATLLGYVRRGAKPEVARRALRLLARNPAGAGLEAVLQAGRADATALSDDTWLRLAERGVGEAQARVEALAAAPEPGFEQVFPAAFLAFRGSDAGRAALRWLYGQPQLLERSPDRWLLAAVALDRLGEAGVWREAVESVVARADAWLDATPSRLAEARWLALRATFYAGLRQAGTPPPVASVLEDAQRHEERSTPRVEGVAGVRALLAELERQAR